MMKVIVSRALRAIANNEARGSLPNKPVLLSTEKNRKSSIDTQPQKSIALNVNGKHRIVMNAHNKTLLRMLREDLGLTGTKEGCAEGECGACTAFMNGDAVMSCLVPAPAAHGAKIETIESLANNDRLHPLQQTFIEEAAVQCGYCTPGFLMSGAKLFEEVRQPTQSEIEQAIAGNLCRCTGYYKILDALKKINEMSK
jgi:carbon-monoxide dehydrogenase medium subunit